MHHRILDTSWTNWIVPNVNLTYIFCDYLYTRKEKLKYYTIKWTGVWIITQWYEWYIHMICAILVYCYFFLSFIEMIFTYSEIRIYKNLHKQNKAATRPRQSIAGKLTCSRRMSSSCSTIGNPHVTVDTNPLKCPATMYLSKSHRWKNKIQINVG